MNGPKPKPLSPGQLERLCQILADTNDGLTGSEIERLLGQCRIADPSPGFTKWKRLYNALAERANRDQSGDRTLAFIAHALDPARYAGQRVLFEDRRASVNTVLALYGLEFGSDGRFHTVQPASSLDEAEGRAHRLRAALSARGVHGDILQFCRAELVENNCFHAVLEASKSVAAKLRARTELTTDGAELVDAALAGPTPRLRINACRTDSERSEQRGFVNLVKGLFGVFRNPTAHEAKSEWPMSEEDALDLFSLASYIHRRIDGAR